MPTSSTKSSDLMSSFQSIHLPLNRILGDLHVHDMLQSQQDCLRCSLRATVPCRGTRLFVPHDMLTQSEEHTSYQVLDHNFRFKVPAVQKSANNSARCNKTGVESTYSSALLSLTRKIYKSLQWVKEAGPCQRCTNE